MVSLLQMNLKNVEESSFVFSFSLDLDLRRQVAAAAWDTYNRA